MKIAKTGQDETRSKREEMENEARERDGERERDEIDG